MISNIFSSFDLRDIPSFAITPSILPWILTFTSLLLFFSSYYLHLTRLTIPLFSILQFLYDQSRRINGAQIVNFPTLTIALFLLILATNLTGIIPYVIGPTAHIAITLSLSFPVWFAIVLSGFTFNPYLSAASLLPSGAPLILSPFLVIVETISMLVRFLTLALRLAANLTVGHVILGALGTYSAFALFSVPIKFSAILTILIRIGFTLFELGVAGLQAYVFFLLTSLYTNDHPINKL